MSSVGYGEHNVGVNWEEGTSLVPWMLLYSACLQVTYLSSDLTFCESTT